MKKRHQDILKDLALEPTLKECHQIIAQVSNDSAVNTRGLQESLLAVNDVIGARVSLNDKDLITMTKMREQAGISNEESID